MSASVCTLNRPALLNSAPLLSCRLPAPLQVTVPALVRVAPLRVTAPALPRLSVLPAGIVQAPLVTDPPFHTVVPVSVGEPL